MKTCNCKGSDDNPAKFSDDIDVIYTPLKSTYSRLKRCCYQYGLALFSRCCLPNLEIPRNSERIRSYSRSMSSKVIDLGINRKRIYDFLLVINIDASPTVFETYTFKARKWIVFPTPPLFDPRWGEAIRISG